jgi:SAM-dependent methyltransferase
VAYSIRKRLIHMCDLINLDYLAHHFSKLTGVRSVLEIGSFNVNGNCKMFIAKQGLRYIGLDLRQGPDVDLVCDITEDILSLHTRLAYEKFDLIICMNVLEHLYEPMKALNNMKQLLREYGYVIIVTPLVWDLHDWPFDFYRLNPDFFIRYAQENNFTILEGTFLFSTRDNRTFFPDIKTLPMILPHLYKQTVARNDFRGIIDDIEGLWDELVKNQLIESNGALKEKFMAFQSDHELSLGPKFAERERDIYAVLQKARIGIMLAYMSRFVPELRECWPHIYMNLIYQKQ